MAEETGFPFNLVIVEEASSQNKKKEVSSLFYIREKPYDPGRSYESTTLSKSAAEKVIKNLQDDYKKGVFDMLYAYRNKFTPND